MYGRLVKCAVLDTAPQAVLGSTLASTMQRVAVVEAFPACTLMILQVIRTHANNLSQNDPPTCGVVDASYLTTCKLSVALSAKAS